MKCYLPFRNLNITLKKAKARAGALAHELVLFVIVAIICLHQIFCQRSKDVPATTQNLFRFCLKCYLPSRNLNITLKKAKARAGALTHELVLFIIVAIICLHQIFCQGSKDVPATTQNLLRFCLKFYLPFRNLKY